MYRASDAPETAAAELAPEETASMDLPMPLKDADRLPSPTYDTVPDGKPVGAAR